MQVRGEAEKGTTTRIMYISDPLSLASTYCTFLGAVKDHAATGLEDKLGLGEKPGLLRELLMIPCQPVMMS